APSSGSPLWSVTVPLIVGRVSATGTSIASELMLTGRFLHAERALRTGLVSEVVPDDQLEQAAASYIDEMLATSRIGLRMTKEGLNLSIDAPSLEAAMAIENRNQLMCSSSSEFRDRMKAFVSGS
ncbi:MAG: enoyl-CoA hydratase-related protein, partial [Candidatus Binatia bacterium]|nr:enoyl-CoA hydratase-related protein [Candidatus Binatia bacterium]